MDPKQINQDLLLKNWKKIDKKLFYFINKQIRNKEDSEDILQNIYLKLYTHIDSLQDEKKIIPWIFQITRNSIIDCIRSCYKHTPLPFDEEMFQEDLAFQMKNLNKKMNNRIQMSIENLAPLYKEIITLYEIDGFKIKEIAKKLDISENTAKTRLRRARLLIKKEIKDCCNVSQDHYGNILQMIKK